MIRSVLSIFLFVCLLSLTVPAQRVPTLSEADKKERLSLEIDDLVGPVRIIATQEAQLTVTTSLSAPIESHRTHIQSILFDADGKVTEILGLGSRTRLRCGTQMPGERKHTEKFDALGRKTEERDEDFEWGKLTLQTVQEYEYDQEGRTRIYKAVMLGADGLILFKWEHKFDEQGRRIESAIYGQYGMLRLREVLTRNDKGLVVESTKYSSESPAEVSRTSMSYEYDDVGNWIICTHSKLITENGKSFFQPVKKVYRTLTYYSPQSPK